MPERFANNARTVLAALCQQSDTWITVASSARFPAQGEFKILVGNEIMNVWNTSNAPVWDVDREKEGTTAGHWPAGTSVDHILTAGVLTQIAADAAAGGLPVVGPNGQVLTVVGGAWASASLPDFELDLGTPSANGHILSSTTAGVRSWIAPPSGGGGSVGTASVTLAADVAIAAGGWTDVLTLALTAGTWVIFGVIQIEPSTAQTVEGRLWDGTNLYGSGAEIFHAASQYGRLALLSAPFTLASATTIRAQIHPSGAAATARASTHPQVGNQAQASRLTALKVA